MSALRAGASGLGAALALVGFFALEHERPPAPAPARGEIARIDFHTHLDPRVPGLVTQVLDMGGIDLAVNLSGGPPGAQLAEARTLEAATGGRVVTFTVINWRRVLEPDFGARIADDLTAAVKQGARGLKIPKALGLAVPTPASFRALEAGRTDEVELLAIDDKRLDPVFERAGELGVPVAIHVADPAAFWQPATPENERWEELRLNPGWSYAGRDVPSHGELIAQAERRYARHPNTTFVGVHVAGWPEDLDEVTRMLETHDNLWIDIAARVPELGRHPPARVRAFFERFEDRILFGTDLGVNRGSIMLGAPLAWRETERDVRHFFASTYRFLETSDRAFAHPTPIQGEWKIDGIDLDESVLRKVYRDNAARLLKLALD